MWLILISNLAYSAYFQISFQKCWNLFKTAFFSSHAAGNFFFFFHDGKLTQISSPTTLQICGVGHNITLIYILLQRTDDSYKYQYQFVDANHSKKKLAVEFLRRKRLCSIENGRWQYIYWIPIFISVACKLIFSLKNNLFVPNMNLRLLDFV